MYSSLKKEEIYVGLYKDKKTRKFSISAYDFLNHGKETEKEILDKIVECLKSPKFVASGEGVKFKKE